MRIFAAVSAVVLACACVSAQTPSTGSSDVPSFDSARAFEHLKALVAIGPRAAGSEGAAKTRAYIRKELDALGLQVVEQPFDAQTPAGTIPMVNLIATVPGASPNRILFASHYDTKRFTEFSFVGANDSGSSTAFLLEFARVLKARRNATTIELVFFDGEEAFGEWETGNTWGSRHYVAAARRDGTLQRIKAMILVDMIGEKDPVFKRESNSTPWLTDIIWSTARKLGRQEFVDAETPVEDDHIPFLEAGIPAVDIIDLEYPYWHEAEDTIDKLSPQSLQAVADVVLAALPLIELRVK